MGIRGVGVGTTLGCVVVDIDIGKFGICIQIIKKDAPSLMQSIVVVYITICDSDLCTCDDTSARTTSIGSNNVKIFTIMTATFWINAGTVVVYT